MSMLVYAPTFFTVWWQKQMSKGKTMRSQDEEKTKCGTQVEHSKVLDPLKRLKLTSILNLPKIRLDDSLVVLANGELASEHVNMLVGLMYHSHELMLQVGDPVDPRGQIRHVHRDGRGLRVRPTAAAPVRVAIPARG
jgi:hypothetical protein